MLLLAAYLTGVLQHGILPRVGHQAATPQQDEQSAISDQRPASQGSEPAPATVSAPETKAPSGPAAQQSAVPSDSQKSEQPSASTGPSSLPTGEQRPAISDQDKALAEKRAELLRLEEQIRKRKEESKIEEKWVAELKATGARLVKERDAKREAGVKKLAKLYEGMEPEAAALIISKLKQEMATEVLASMKDRQASKVLAAMNGQKAKELSERLEDVRLEQTANEGKAVEAAR